MSLSRLSLLLVAVLASPAWAGTPIEVFKSPRCGCCQKWVEHLEQNGFEVSVQEVDNLQPVKERARIPAGKGSCHTAFVDGYAIEGHVPASGIKRLLEEKPDARGLTVPGMPVGSPGMEMGDRKDAYEVLLFRQNGETETFSQH